MPTSVPMPILDQEATSSSTSHLCPTAHADDRDTHLDSRLDQSLLCVVTLTTGVGGRVHRVLVIRRMYIRTTPDDERRITFLQILRCGSNLHVVTQLVERMPVIVV